MTELPNIGDVVCLSSGGIKMTVIDINGDQVECAWSTRADQKSRVFPLSCVRSFDAVDKIEVVFVSPNNDSETGDEQHA